jgi:hypothetical protein
MSQVGPPLRCIRSRFRSPYDEHHRNDEQEYRILANHRCSRLHLRHETVRSLTDPDVLPQVGPDRPDMLQTSPLLIWNQLNAFIKKRFFALEEK